MTSLSDETIDGLEFEMRLLSSPQITTRREAFDLKIRLFREAALCKSKTQMIAELKTRNPAYILALLEAKSEAEIRDRYVWTFVHGEES